MWAVIASLVLCSSVGDLNPSELKTIRSLSFEISLREYLKVSAVERRSQQWAETTSSSSIFHLGATGLSAAMIVQKSKSPSRCRRNIRRISWAAVSAGFAGTYGYRLKQIWFSEGRDPEMKWLAANASEWTDVAKNRRTSTLLSIYRDALRRDFDSNAKIEVALSSEDELWTGLSTRAWVDGQAYTSRFQWNADRTEILSFDWVLK